MAHKLARKMETRLFSPTLIHSYGPIEFSSLQPRIYKRERESVCQIQPLKERSVPMFLRHTSLTFLVFSSKI